MYRVNLKGACRRRGITLGALARRASIPQPSLSRYDSGRSDITLRQLGRIAAALGTGPWDLVEERGVTGAPRGAIRRREREEPRRDKRWVTRVLLDLAGHYRRARADIGKDSGRGLGPSSRSRRGHGMYTNQFCWTAPRQVGAVRPPPRVLIQ